ncbi:MAG: ABC transporter ATP-binding protein/permease, partial [Nanoarchaeota archaeon]|nr:ABC transporter ATP-binding protein/permease [Nanoarchaeota archaeon]
MVRPKKAKNSVTKFFLDLSKSHKKELIKIITIATLGSVLTVFVPYIYGRLFDLALIPNTTVTLLLSLIGLWALLGLISNFTSVRTSALGDVLGARLSLESEVEAYGHFLTLPASFHKTKKTGEILQKVSRGSWNLQYFIQILANVLPSIIFLVFAMIAMLILKWQLGLIIFVAFALYAFFTLRLTKPLLKSQERMHKAFEKEYGNVYDKLYNVFLIKNFAMEEVEKKRFLKSFIGRALPPYKDSAEKFAKLSHLQGIIYNLSFVIVLGAAIFFLRGGQLTQGEFIMFFGYINLSFSPFFRLSEFYNFYKRASVSIKRIIKLKNMVPEAMQHGDKILKNFKGNILFKNINFGYNKDKNILKNI